MENIHDPKNIIGMGEILADDEDIDIEELEKSITAGISYKAKDDNIVDIAKNYNKELDQLSTQFKLNDIGNYNTGSMSNPVNNNYQANDPGISSKPSLEQDNWSPFGMPDMQADDTASVKSSASWSTKKPSDEYLNQMTNEEVKQQHIKRVIGNIDRDGDDKFIHEEDEEDEMARIIEQIDLLRTNLESEGVDLSRIQEITPHHSKKEARSVLKILQIKNDRLRYCDMFEEGILAVAYGLESMFDGKKVWFATQIDLTGWSDTVKVKLRRMRYDTSTFVGEIMKGYNMGSGWRILFELLPSLFLYSRDRRLHRNDNLASDEQYRKAINEMGS